MPAPKTGYKNASQCSRYFLRPATEDDLVITVTQQLISLYRSGKNKMPAM